MRPVNFGTLSGTLLTLGVGAPPDLDTMILGMTAEPRWRGQTRVPWTLAHHALLVARLVPPEYRAEALHHDDEEVFLGDWPTPVVEAATIGGVPAEEFRAMVRKWAASPWFTFEGEGLSPAVKAADRRALVIEATMLCHPRMLGWLGVKGNEGISGVEATAYQQVTDFGEHAGMRWAIEVLDASRAAPRSNQDGPS